MKWNIPYLKVDENTFIKKIEEKDLEELFEIYSDPEVLKFTDEEPFLDISYMKLFYESVIRGYVSEEYFELKIEYLNKAIGTCDFHSIDKVNNQCEIGFLLNRDYWGKGIMKKCITELVKYLINVLEIRTIIADIEDQNINAIKLIQKLGFIHISQNTYIVNRK